MQQQFSVTTETAKLARHTTLPQFSRHLRQRLAHSGFDKFIYYALPVNCHVIDNALNYCTAGLEPWMQEYLQHNYYLLDPLRAQLLTSAVTLKFQLTSTQVVYQPFASTLARNQTALAQLCTDAGCMQLHTTANTQVICAVNITAQAVVDLFIAHNLHQGIGLILNNYRSMSGVIYLGYGGSSANFASAYTVRKFAPLESFIGLWHQKLQSKLSAKFNAERLTRLTARERDIMELLAHGYTNTQIMTSLGISFSTVRTHINNILAKFRARNVTQACVLALHMGLLD